MSADSALTKDRSPSRASAERAVLATLWIGYGALYFGRSNLAAAVPGLQSELHLSKTDIGFILGALKLAYGIGQLVNGQLAERVNPRRLFAVGLFGSAALNLVFGLGAGLWFLAFVWALNGYCQALGWTPCMRVLANWIPSSRRGRAIGLLGTSYQIGAAITFVASGWAAQRYGWRAALVLPSVVLALAGLFILLFLREAPAASPTEALTVREAPRASLFANLGTTLGNPYLWLLALALAFLNACRFGFLDWGLSYLAEVQHTGIDTAALKFAIVPLGGVAGALATGWFTDRVLGGRRAPAICVLLFVLGLTTLVYDHVARTSVVGTVLLLVVVGFCIFGPQVLLVGTAPSDVARRGTAAAAAGFVDFMGYMGASAGDQVTGFAVDHAGSFGWRAAIWVWAGWAFAASAMSGLLWIAMSRRKLEASPNS